MKKFLISFLFAVLPLVCTAKVDDRAPGLYAMVDGESIPLNFTYGSASISGKDLHGVEVVFTTYSYKGETSGTEATGTFHLVLDQKKHKVEKLMKKYNPFIRNMRPDKVTIVPLKVNAETKCREFYVGKKMDNIRIDDNDGIKFEAVKIRDNSYSIKVQDLPPGEYGFAFCEHDILGTDYEAIYGFTIK